MCDRNEIRWETERGIDAVAFDRPEFPDAGNDRMPFSRRDFLRLAGFTAAGGLAACARAPVQKSIPLLYPIETVTPGVSVDYATSCHACEARCGLLVKTRDGRPIKIEGFRGTTAAVGHPVSGFGTCAVGQAAPLALYDSRRLSGPQYKGSATSWSDADAAIRAALAAARQVGRGVRMIGRTVNGPSTLARIEAFSAAFPSFGHVQFDPVGTSGILTAHERVFGQRLLPRVIFERAIEVVSFDCDFLGSWYSPVEHARGFVSARSPTPGQDRLRLTQIEGRMSLTGGKADERILVDHAQRLALLVGVVAGLQKRAERAVPDSWRTAMANPIADRVAERLWRAKGHSLVLCGANDVDHQVLAAHANHLIGAYGTTLDIDRPSLQRRGVDSDVATLIEEMEAGQVGVLIVHDSDPSQELVALGDRFHAALSHVDHVICTSARVHLTSERATWILPEPHFLECFDDSEPIDGVFSFTQPVFAAIGERRSLRASLAAWMNDETDDDTWTRTIFERRIRPRLATTDAAEDALTKARQEGFRIGEPRRRSLAFDVTKATESPIGAAPQEAGLELVLSTSLSLLDGRHAENAWLQELPDPVDKSTWGNVAAVAPELADELGIDDGDEIEIESIDTGFAVRVPIQTRVGQHRNVIALDLGHGRRGTSRFAGIGPSWFEARPTVNEAGRVGVAAESFGVYRGDSIRTTGLGIRVARTGRRVAAATTQSHHTLTVPAALAPAHGDVRDPVRALSRAELTAGRSAARHAELGHGLWHDDHENGRAHWELIVDLDRCTGCSACALSCQVENNVPVVGRDEVVRAREMHWLRIDRYFSGSGAGARTAHQPMMCQHCDNAPCETVCPVLATVHSEEGLNQQVYNRCVGTRYCANNCPYKVRRFNWFDYPRDDALANLALNPDVTVRTRGVMEKCSFCVQRIQEKKSLARAEGRPIRDGEIEPACVQVCPTRALRFGDASNAASAVSIASADPRHYRVLDELNVRPSVGYLALVREPETGD